jgi:hypothetical protein
VAAALAPALLAAGAGAQSWETQDEIAFAKNLARFRLFDLATEYIEKLEKSELPQDERLACLYAHAFIEKVGGDYDTTTEGRLGLLKAAIGHYGEFLSRIGPEHKNADDARGEAAACQRRLGSLLAGLAAQGVDPAANRAAAETAFRDAVKQLNALFNERKKRYEAMEDADPNDPDFDPDERTTKDEAKIDAYDTVYELSATYYEWSQLYPENDVNRHDYLKKCLDQSNEYLWEMGAETVRAYEVTFYAGLAHLGLNNVEDGLASLEYIVDDSEAGSGIPKVIDRYPDLPPGFVADLTRMVEKTFLELARIRNRRSEYPDTDKLAARMEEFYKKYASRGAKRSETGEQFLLEVGMARFRSGNAAGMKLLEEVAQRNPANDVGQRAGELIAEVVRASASAGNGAVKLPPSTWITTAKAARNQNRLLDAIDGWHHAIGALPQISDQKERAKTAAECWYDIGNGYRTLGRNVEAALAFREGLAVASAGKDVEEDVVQQIGISWYQTLVARFKETKDPQDRKTKDEALRKLAIDYNVKDTRYLVAKDEFEQARAIPTERKEDKAKAFAECAAKLGDVKQDDSQYDRARILLARCEGEQGELDRKHFETALRTLDAFDKHAREHEPPPEKARLQHREISRVESVYYRSEYLLALEQHDKLLEVLKNFEKDFPGRREFLPEVRYRQLRALIALGRLPEAEAHYAAVTQQIESGELASWRDTASFYLSRAFLAQADQEADAGKRNELLRKGADLMVTYCRDTQYTSFPNLHLAAETYARIGTWPKAEETYRKLVEVFGKEAQYREQIDQRVKRQLAQVLMEQRKFKEAEPIFRELEIRFPKDPTLLRTAALCYGGWVDIEDKKAVEVPGSGEYKRAIELWELLVDKGFPRETEKQNPGWYEAKFHTIFCRWRAKESDPSYLPQAQKLLQNFEANVWPFIQDEAEFLTWIGGENWKRRWDYLRERLR